MLDGVRVKMRAQRHVADDVGGGPAGAIALPGPGGGVKRPKCGDEGPVVALHEGN